LRGGDPNRKGDRAKFAARFQQIYGKPLDQAEREWRTFCASFR